MQEQPPLKREKKGIEKGNLLCVCGDGRTRAQVVFHGRMSELAIGKSQQDKVAATSTDSAIQMASIGEEEHQASEDLSASGQQREQQLSKPVQPSQASKDSAIQIASINEEYQASEDLSASGQQREQQLSKPVQPSQASSSLQKVHPVSLETPSSQTLQSISLEDASAVKPTAVPHRSVRNIGSILFFIGLWYVNSITITLYNKWLFSTYGLHFPLLITSTHIALKIPASRVLMWCLKMAPVRFNSWRVVAFQVMPAGVAMTGDIAFSNLAFLYTTVTYYTIVKSSVPLWIMIFSACYGLLRVRADLVFVLVLIGCGISLASVDFVDAGGNELVERAANRSITHLHAAVNASSVLEGHGALNHTLRRLGDELGSIMLGSSGRRQLRGDTQHVSENPALGALLVLAASMCSGFRWACTQMLMSPPKQEDQANLRDRSASKSLLNPITLLYYTSPYGLLVLLPFALAMEAAPCAAYLYDRSNDVVLVVALVLLGACLGLTLLLTELRVVQLASGLTLSVAGIFKEVLTVIAAAALLGDALTPIKVSGLLICILGIAMYQRSRFLELRREVPMQIDR